MSSHFSDLQFVDLPPNRVAYRQVGVGEPLLLVHGYPLSSLTFRHIAPALADRFRCIVPDLLGAGETEWTDGTDFSFAAQAQTLKDLADALGLTSYRVLAHDTGGTIVRQLALIDPDRVISMVLIGTEIPNHRPPFIQLLHRIANPEVTVVFKLVMRSRRFLASKAAFGGCFWDRRLIFGEFHATHIAPVLASDRRIQGLTHYLLGIDWTLVDGLAQRHREITAPTILVWGEEDTVFPVQDARPMVDQLGDCRGFITVPRSRLFVHEERPDEIVRIAGDFFAADGRRPTADRLRPRLSVRKREDLPHSSWTAKTPRRTLPRSAFDSNVLSRGLPRLPQGALLIPSLVYLRKLACGKWESDARKTGRNCPESGKMQVAWEHA